MKIQTPGYFGQIMLLNGKKEHFTREQLASVFLNRERYKAYIRSWKTVRLNGTVISTANSRLANEVKVMYEYAKKAGYPGILTDEIRESYDFTPATREISKNLGIPFMTVTPDRGCGFVEVIEVKTVGTEREHDELMGELYEKIQSKFLNLILDENCYVAGPCRITKTRRDTWLTKRREVRQNGILKVEA